MMYFVLRVLIMERFIFDLGLGWTMSKVLPYFVFLVLGLIVMVFIRKYAKNRKLRIGAIVVSIIPLSVYFMINPIYESDFANDFSSHQPLANISEVDHLTIIAIPNCQYCREALGRLMKIQERTSSVKIDFKVLTSDSLTLAPYIDEANGLINVVKEENFAEFEKVAETRFPTYVYTSSSESRVWHNDQIGTRALDWLEEQLNK